MLGHPARVRILELLRDGERSVGALQAELGLDSGATSQHLAAFRRVGLVEPRREGTSVFYRVPDERAFDLLEAGRALVTRRLGRSSRCWRSSPGRDLAVRCSPASSVSRPAARSRAPFHVHGGSRRPGDRCRWWRPRAWELLTGGVAGAAFTSGFEPRFGVDGLSGLFLAVLGAVGACALLFASRSLAVGTGPCDRRADWRVRARAGACAGGA